MFLVGEDNKLICNFRDFLLLINSEFGISESDLAELMLGSFTGNIQQYPEFSMVVEDIVKSHEEYLRSGDGLYGDAYYIAMEDLQNAQEEIRAEIDNLRSKSRKNNTKADIAKRLENIVSNMDYIL